MATQPAVGRMRPARMLCQRGTGCPVVGSTGKGGFGGSRSGARGREAAAQMQQLVAQPACSVLCQDAGRGRAPRFGLKKAFGVSIRGPADGGDA